ncbi:hypothetical protein DK66_3118 [Brucella suis 1330]|nr:hypothetical protein DK66_3118 [Brucella suis 1330]
MLATHSDVLTADAIHSVTVQHGAHVRLGMSETLIIANNESASGQTIIVQCLTGKTEMPAGVEMFRHTGKKPFEFAHVRQHIRRYDQIPVFFLCAFEKAYRLAHEQRIVIAFFIRHFDHVFRNVDAGFVCGHIVQRIGGKARSTAQIKHTFDIKRIVHFKQHFA